ncbi:serine/threonine-protein kinase GD17699-like [Copidosoma floridanum]|uniref:serine/threonine-protein kinase GD17699-like n=1 Tax=Copidosoma floridanum TaxID=29053 RepID=UPI0006C9AA1E|nr:serine/threonine-protein kinase GD17699-like [Copidosoma floridanum]
MDETLQHMSILCSKENSHPDNIDLDCSNTITVFHEHFIENSDNDSLSHTKMLTTKKAKRIRFFRNGDKFFNGIVIAVTPERYRCFDSLISDLTRALISNVNLPNGVRIIYTMDGKKVHSISDLEDGKCYVVSGQGEIFKKIGYSSLVKKGNLVTGFPLSPSVNVRQANTVSLCIKAKIITLIRSGIKPRKIVRLLLNRRNSTSVEHILESITEVIKLDSGTVKKVYSLSGQQIISLEQFFSKDDIFIIYGNEKLNHEDFELDYEESKCVKSFHKGHFNFQKHNGPMPKMPARKTDKRLLNFSPTRTTSPFKIDLPDSFKLEYSVGHIIGDGNFAVVRHCIHKLDMSAASFPNVQSYPHPHNRTFPGPIIWPSRPPDPNPLDYFLWSMIKDAVYRYSVHDVEDLEDCSSAVFESVTPKMVVRAMDHLSTDSNAV